MVQMDVTVDGAARVAVYQNKMQALATPAALYSLDCFVWHVRNGIVICAG